MPGLVTCLVAIIRGAASLIFIVARILIAFISVGFTLENDWVGQSWTKSEKKRTGRGNINKLSMDTGHMFINQLLLLKLEVFLVAKKKDGTERLVTVRPEVIR